METSFFFKCNLQNFTNYIGDVLMKENKDMRMIHKKESEKMRDAVERRTSNTAAEYEKLVRLNCNCVIKYISYVSMSIIYKNNSFIFCRTISILKCQETKFIPGTHGSSFSKLLDIHFLLYRTIVFLSRLAEVK